MISTINNSPRDQHSESNPVRAGSISILHLLKQNRKNKKGKGKKASTDNQTGPFQKMERDVSAQFEAKLCKVLVKHSTTCTIKQIANGPD
jgi:hypothetical protein